MPQPSAAANERARLRELREGAVAFAALTAMALLGAALGWHPFALVVAAFAASAIATLGWIYFAEHRKPWPIGPRVLAAHRTRLDYLGFFAACAFSVVQPWPSRITVPASSGIGTPLKGWEGVVNEVLLPANSAATVVAFVGIVLIVPLAGRLIAAVWRTARTDSEPTAQTT